MKGFSRAISTSTMNTFMGIGITIKSDDEAGAAELIWLNNRHFLPVNFYVSSSASATKSLHIGLEHIFPTRTNNSTDAFVTACLR